MRRNRFRPGDDAVSPVVGVVLLVGIAVMLMTTVGVFVLGFGPGEPPPEAEVQFHEETGGNVTISVVDAANMQEEEVTVTVNGSAACYDGIGWSGSGPLETGESVTINGTSSSCTGVSSNSTVTVIWESGGGASAIVGRYRTI